MSDDLTEAERIYEQVKARLDQAEQAHVAELKAKRDAGDRYVSYGHDLYQAIARAKLREKQEIAATLFNDHCKSSVFHALPAILHAAFEFDKPPASTGETQLEHIRRGLETALRNLDRDYERREKRA